MSQCELFWEGGTLFWVSGGGWGIILGGWGRVGYYFGWGGGGVGGVIFWGGGGCVEGGALFDNARCQLQF